jgi:hypothetical protein
MAVCVILNNSPIAKPIVPEANGKRYGLHCLKYPIKENTNDRIPKTEEISVSQYILMN